MRDPPSAVLPRPVLAPPGEPKTTTATTATQAEKTVDTQAMALWTTRSRIDCRPTRRTQVNFDSGWMDRMTFATLFI